jgi:radical SAM protein with 4Fe4S-binding SPASM domain
MFKCSGQLIGLDSVPQDLALPASADGILVLDIDLSLNGLSQSLLNIEEISSVLIQAKALGARKVMILAVDEDTQPFVLEVLKSIAAAGLQIEFFKRDPVKIDFQRRVCFRHQYSCALTLDGNVFACPGINIPLGNIKEAPLKEIIGLSEILEELRGFLKSIKSPCRLCGIFGKCYGCRGAAYQETGDYLAADHGCPRNADKLSQIIKLPMDIERLKLVPHRRPMLLVDSLDGVGERSAKVRVEIKPDNLFLDAKGVLDEVVYMEMMAQAAAALNGFNQLGVSESVLKGFLLGVKNMVVYTSACAGDVLDISVFKYGRFEEFGILRCKINRGQDVLAEGEIKIWHQK